MQHKVLRHLYKSLKKKILFAEKSQQRQLRHTVYKIHKRNPTIGQNEPNVQFSIWVLIIAHHKHIIKGDPF